MAFTVQDILNARPNLSFDGTLTGDMELVRDDAGYAVKMTGYYTVPELIAIARDVQNLNVVFDERPETDSFIVYSVKTGETFGYPYAKKSNAVDEAWRLEGEFGIEHLDVKAIPTK